MLVFLNFTGFDYFSFNFGTCLVDPRWPPFDNHDVISTSYDVITFLCKSHCRSFYTYEDMKGGPVTRKNIN